MRGSGPRRSSPRMYDSAVRECRTTEGSTATGVGLRELCRRICHLSLRNYYKNKRDGAAHQPMDFQELWKQMSEPWLQGLAIDPVDEPRGPGRAEVVDERRRMWQIVVEACAARQAVCVGFFDIAGRGLSKKEEVTPNDWWRCFPPKAPLETSDIAFGSTVVRNPTIYCAVDWFVVAPAAMPTGTMAAGSKSSAALDLENPEEEPKSQRRQVVSIERMRDEARAVYDARRADPPNVNEAYKLVCKNLEKEGLAAPRSILRDRVLREPEFTDLRRPSGKPL
jgi:hypothetical protein